MKPVVLRDTFIFGENIRVEKDIQNFSAVSAYAYYSHCAVLWRFLFYLQ